MPWNFFEISSYKIHQVSAKTPGFEGASAFITLYWDGVERAKLWFTFGDAAPDLPNSIPQPGSPVYDVRFRGTQFQGVVDVLRNEKPVYLHWNTASGGAFIATGQEPVGQDEA